MISAGDWFVGYRFADKGGCPTQVAASDQVFIAFDAFKADKPGVRVEGDVVFIIV